jgi:hypothetical protein
VLWGTDDPVMPANCADVFRHEISGRATLAPRPGWTLPMLTRPQEFNRALLVFLGNDRLGGEVPRLQLQVVKQPRQSVRRNAA